MHEVKRKPYVEAKSVGSSASAIEPFAGFS